MLVLKLIRFGRFNRKLHFILLDNPVPTNDGMKD
jgi:hypothetical protein